MYHTQNGLRRRTDRSSHQLFALSFFVLITLAAAGSDWDREGAKRAWEDASQQREALSQSPAPSRDAYLKCIRTYQRVQALDPHFPSSGDALYQAAVLFQELGDKSGGTGDYRSAARQFEFFVKDYSGHYLCPDALLRLGKLYRGPLADEQSASAVFDRLRTLYKSSAAARELALLDKIAAEKPSIPARNAQEATPNTTSPAAPVTHSIVKAVEFSSEKDLTKISIALDSAVHFSEGRIPNPERVYFDISDATLDRSLWGKTISVDDSLIKQIRVAQFQPETVRIVLELASAADYSVSQLRAPNSIAVEIRRKGAGIFETGNVTKPSPNQADAKRPAPVNSISPSPRISQGAAQQAVLPPLASQAAAPPGKSADASVSAGIATATTVPAKPASSTLETPKRSQVIQPNAHDANAAAAPPAVLKQEPPPAVANPSTPTKALEKEGAAQPAHIVAPPPSATTNAAGKETEKPNVVPAPIVPNNPSLPKPAAPTSRGDRTLTRTLGLKIGRIVLDPGHGGPDEGTIGPGGLVEKDLVLQVAKELQKLLEEKLGAEVILTRTDDAFVSLDERTAIANREQADLFLSIHANASPSRSTSGVETYFLDFARSDAAREVAARENSTSGRNVHDLQDLIAKIAQADKVEESREFAAAIQKNLLTTERKILPASQDRGVRSAPFVVLIGAHMPSVLVEVAFISNPKDEKVLRKDTSQQSLATALFRGIEAYMKALGSGLAQTSANQIK